MIPGSYSVGHRDKRSRRLFMKASQLQLASIKELSLSDYNTTMLCCFNQVQRLNYKMSYSGQGIKSRGLLSLMLPKSMKWKGKKRSTVRSIPRNMLRLMRIFNQAKLEDTDIPFKHVSDLCFVRSAYKPPKEFGEVLQDFIRKRAEMGVPLQSLEISDLPAENEAWFRRNVPRFSSSEE